MLAIEKFRKAMTESRISRCMSKSDLARKIKKSPSFICDIENKRKNPSVETMIDISNVLDISLDKILK